MYVTCSTVNYSIISLGFRFVRKCCLFYFMHVSLVCGCNDCRLQGKLLAESDLTFDKAFTLATAYESAVQGTKQIESSSPTLQVVSAPHKFQKSHRPKNPSSSCFRCGGTHTPTGCRFKEINCNYCGKQGHIAKVCFSRERNQHRKPKQFHKKRESTNQNKQMNKLSQSTRCTEHLLFHLPPNHCKWWCELIALTSRWK